MKNYVELFFKKVIYTLFIVGILAFVFYVYKDTKSSFALKSIRRYVYLAFGILLYLPFVTIVNYKKLKWVGLSKRLVEFVFMLLLFIVLFYCLDYVFRPLDIDLVRQFSYALGSAFGMTFMDVTLLKIKEN